MRIEDDKELEKSIKDLKQLHQRVYSLNDQLRYLRIIANKFGLYDASDYLQQTIK